jgi:hypothetical protein
VPVAVSWCACVNLIELRLLPTTAGGGGIPSRFASDAGLVCESVRLTSATRKKHDRFLVISILKIDSTLIRFVF